MPGKREVFLWVEEEGRSYSRQNKRDDRKEWTQATVSHRPKPGQCGCKVAPYIETDDLGPSEQAVKIQPKRWIKFQTLKMTTE